MSREYEIKCKENSEEITDFDLKQPRTTLALEEVSAVFAKIFSPFLRPKGCSKIKE